MIFRPVTFISFFSLFALGACLIYFHTTIRTSDQLQYKKITQETTKLRSSKSLERNPAYQVRENAQKDIWKIRGEERVHFQLHSNHSRLSLKQKKDQVSVKEELEEITCLSEAGLFFASKGFYDYPGHNFEASHVECTHELGNIKANKALLYSITSNEKNQLLSLDEGVSLIASKENHPLSIFSQRALCELSQTKSFSFSKEQKIEFFEQVEIQMNEGLSGAKFGIIHLENSQNDQIQAKGGYAIYKEGFLILHPENLETYCHLHQEKHRIDAQEIHFDLLNETILCLGAKGELQIEGKKPLVFSSDRLLWQKGQGTVDLEENVEIKQEDAFLIQAGKAKIILENQKPAHIEIGNNVRLFSSQIQNKDTFAIADKVLLDPEKQTLILTREPPHRVLFWQKGVSLSAPEIHIQKDPVTKEECIQGKGDVHFSFTTEEQNIIDLFISKYL